MGLISRVSSRTYRLSTTMDDGSDSGDEIVARVNTKINKDLLHKLYRVSQTIYQMLHDRGYLIFEEDLEMSFHAFKQQFTQPETYKIVASHQDDMAKRIVVRFYHIDYNADDQKTPILSRTQIDGYIQSLDEDAYPDLKTAITSLILVTNCAIGTTVKTRIGPTALGGKGSVEVFKEGELMVNITDHRLVADYKLLDTPAKSQILRKLKITEDQIPRMSKDDIISRYYCAQQGDVFRIIRKSEVAGRYLYYRIVQ